ncbi:methyl-accepting chemotaxis protein [Paenibacillus sp. 1011MAR3C5]|uniref:methyl-accepting chemotaxis protein n=1 Tax=Paenibacillus sp. 1011MAR3C5 TaxID=1675787 RepID=UPI000E6CC63C|nr:methyl-accepting chemotaxis protein [Paenibacillus sp. 1011MAR3C5]RJE90739.1 methyl-accepting chemotaxis protein [Paenibacillus sp. 1011MAR3C5]
MMSFSLRWKIAVMAVLPLLCYAVSVLYVLGEERKTFNIMAEEIYENANQVESLILNADRDMYQAYVAYLKIESGKLEHERFISAQTDMSENKDQATERIAAAKALMEKADLLHLAHGASGKTAGEIFDAFDTAFNNWFTEAYSATEDGKAEISEQIEGDFRLSRSGIDEVGESMDIHAEETIKRIEKDLDKNQLSTLISMIVVAALLIGYSAMMIKFIMNTIRSVVRKTKLVGEGDLTVEPDRKYIKDELGQISRSVDDMIANMNGLITGIMSNTRKVSESSSQLASAASESASASENVAQNIQEVATSSESQARGAKEMSRAIEEMAVGIGRIAENTSDIADQSNVTTAQADQGQDALHRLVGQMDEIKTVITKLSDTIGTLENRSQQIGAIAENITAFSNQTNILSLNASIEAARAGEHGRGFAVVAGEIRKLAASSLESAEHINDLVTLTQQEISGASGYMRETMQQVEYGGERMKDVSHNLNLIAASITQMTQQIQENSAITQQMSASSEEVSASVEQSATSAVVNLEKTESVAAATEEQLALMESISSSSKELDAIVRELNSSVAHFKVKQ